MKTFNYKNLILDSLDLEYLAEYAAPGVNSGAELVGRAFAREFGYMLPHRTAAGACCEYLLGLPTAVTIPYMNGEIVELLAEAGENVTDATAAVDRYWIGAGAALANVITGGGQLLTTTHEPGEHRAFIGGYPVGRVESTEIGLVLALRSAGRDLKGARLLGQTLQGHYSLFNHWVI